MPAILNISSYKFISLDDLPLLQRALKQRCVESGLRGTVLLAAEGINLFLSGEEAAVRGVIDWLREDPRFADLRTKDSWSEQQPFQKMQVKIKGEIIRMNHPTIRPQDGRSPSVSAQTLRGWLERGQDEEGRPVVLLDTRNAFEVGYGTFKG
ncbi:MAG TPA: sulfurtransferase, partial [Myxococcota bacterium]|nr:sulfurtransferase [Myxococcota bacterium]